VMYEFHLKLGRKLVDFPLVITELFPFVRTAKA